MFYAQTCIYSLVNSSVLFGPLRNIIRCCYDVGISRFHSEER